MTLPHRFPFRLIDRVDGRRATLGWTAGAWWARGAATPALPLLVEAVAQAAALLLAETAPGGAQQLLLAGIEDATHDGTASAGETLSIEVRLLARLGSVVRVRGDLLRGEAPCGGVTLILSSGGRS